MLEHERVVGQPGGGRPRPHQRRRQRASQWRGADGGRPRPLAGPRPWLRSPRRQVDDLALLLAELRSRRVVRSRQNLSKSSNSVSINLSKEKMQYKILFEFIRDFAKV